MTPGVWPDMGWKRLLLAGAAVLAFGASNAQANSATVEVGQTLDRFTNANVTINPGDMVHWHWDATFHSVTSGQPPGTADGVFDSGVKQALPASFDQAFNHPGVYHYYCQIHFAEGMVGTITVTGSDPAPSAAFGFAPASPVRGQSVHFDASGSATSDSDVFDTYQWNFGDGSLPQTTNLPSVDHTFTSAGTHSVKLTVTDSGSATSAVSHSVVVALPPDTAPVARFTTSPSPARAGGLVHFNGGASSDSDGDKITSYRWSFGDGVSQTTTTPATTHRYAHAGTMDVSLVVVDERGTPSTTLTRALTVLAAAPKLAKLKAGGCLKKSRHCGKPGIHVHFTLSSAVKVTITVSHKGHKNAVRRKTVSAKAGKNTVNLAAKGLKAGRYTLTAVPKGGKAVKVGLKLA